MKDHTTPQDLTAKSAPTLGSPCLVPYYQRDGITIYHGDCLEFMPAVRLHRANIVITSPPYNLGARPWDGLGHWESGNASGSGGRGRWQAGCSGGDGAKYDAHDDSMPWEDYERWQREVIRRLWGFLPEHGAIFYNHKPRVIGDRLWMPTSLLPADATLRQIITWARPGGMNFNKNAFVPTYEWIMVIAKNEWRLRDRSASSVGDVWQMAPEKNAHPAPFPTELPARVIAACETDCVFDPFGGSGTTMLAAKRAGVRGVMVEKSERYCEIAANRLSQGVLF